MTFNSCILRSGLITCLLGISSLAFADDQTYSLTYRFQTGQFYHIETNDRGEITTQNGASRDKDGNPQEGKSFQQTQMLKSYRVVTTDENGGAVIEPIVEKVRMASTSTDRPVVTFDSSSGEQPPKGFEEVASTLGRPLARFHVASNGRLIKVNMLVTDVPKSFSEAANKADPSINFLTVLPEKPVKVGDRWSERFEMPVTVSKGLTQKLGMIKSFQLTKVENNVATITSHTNLLTPTEDPEILRQIAQMISVTTIEFDVEQGCILSRTIAFDEKVVNAFGAQTLLHAKGQSVEKLLPKGAVTSRVANGQSGAPSLLPK
jgi:hypothetical protein